VKQIDPAAYPGGDKLGRTGARPLGFSLWRSLVVLFKARVVLLLLFAAIGGAIVASDGWPGTWNLVILVISGGLAAAGASAINQYLEQGLDARMERTKQRPLASQSLTPGRWVPYLGGLMIVLPSLALLPFNPALAFFLLLGAGIYLGVYTIWLKPRTPLNIVIGGAAGSAAVLSGSAAAGQWNEPGAILLALLVFLWTPTHFWSLAIAYRDDYARGGFPMLPVQVSPRAAARWVLLHAGGAALAAFALCTRPNLGWGTLLPTSVATTCLLLVSAGLVAAPSKRRALMVFHTSNLFLAVMLLAICLDTLFW
jgi:protoheme IX farnesyltransferase